MKNGKSGNKKLGPETGDMTSFKNIEDFFSAFKNQMEYFVYHLVEADNCVDYAHAERELLPYQH